MVLFIPLLTHKNSANKPMTAYSRSLRSREKELTLVRKKVCAHERKLNGWRLLRWKWGYIRAKTRHERELSNDRAQQFPMCCSTFPRAGRGVGAGSSHRTPGGCNRMKRGVRQQGESASSSAGIIAHSNVLLLVFRNNNHEVSAFLRIIYLCI